MGQKSPLPSVIPTQPEKSGGVAERNVSTFCRG